MQNVLQNYLEEGILSVLTHERSAPSLIGAGECFFCGESAIKQCPTNPHHKICNTCYERLEHATKTKFYKFRFTDYAKAPEHKEGQKITNKAYRYIGYGTILDVFKETEDRKYKYVVNPVIPHTQALCCCICSETYSSSLVQTYGTSMQKGGSYIDIPVGTMNSLGASVGGKAFMCWKCKSSIDRVVNFYGLQTASLNYVETYSCPRCSENYTVTANEDNARTEILAVKLATRWLCPTCFLDVHSTYCTINGKLSYNKRHKYINCSSCGDQKSIDLMTVTHLESLHEFICAVCLQSGKSSAYSHTIKRQDDFYFYSVEMNQLKPDYWAYVIHRARKPSDHSPASSSNLLSWKVIKLSNVEGTFSEILWEALEDLEDTTEAI